ncbi:FAD-binding domain-containing protein [Gloeophyllum trabeum ATCC 11539]|uniref:D-lactate dehydrogenase (cytochrome) n=1 Tax=Gloeophyllum trabeum (strain ATCC 11539 / FP-39264 / Madison 617) TaxID=670483 RepID=S7QI77_GLOTA|nr:FAD-binding domain-containing protein [Gloeophyllum trabeum ATCC 11539]EPQ58897.1 FAD-binding domain-containing protein [Gloeophyllum trabeum ATCC 11539]
MMDFVGTMANAPPPGYASPHDLALALRVLDELSLRIVSTDPATLRDYPGHAALVRPRSTEDVVRIVTVANAFRVPLVPWGGGTSLEGQVAGYEGRSICVDMSGMDQILEIHEDDGDLVCQAGATWDGINETLRAKGVPLFFPLDPGPGATIGGMIATGCSGTNAVRYGTARGEWFLNVTVVLPDASVIKTRRRARKSAAGFDLTRLFVGAEGTLGIVTEATLRLAPVLPTRVALAQFADVDGAVGAVQAVLNSPWGAHLQCVELMDDNSQYAPRVVREDPRTLIHVYACAVIRALNASSSPSAANYPALDTLLFKLQGPPAFICATASHIRATVAAHGCTHFQFAQSEEAAARMWAERKHALGAARAWVPGARGVGTDVCVPPSNLPRLVGETKRDLARAGITTSIVGHVGDGNFHAMLYYKNEEERKAVQEAAGRLVERAWSLGGTCTGEHGVGTGKKAYLEAELGEGTVALMRAVKKAVDPKGIMNPGKNSRRR